MGGPLQGVKVVELAGIGPGPYCAMLLADLGADVIRVDRAAAVPEEMPATGSREIMNRGRRSVGVDLKHPEGRATVLDLVASADALIEGFRPGVTERLGLGPDDCRARNPRLVYGRMTGWGQEGPLAHAAGHDINYVALSGVLSTIGRRDEGPVPPLNLVGDFGGGGLMLAFGVVCGILEARTSGQGQVIDAAMVDGAANLATFIFGMRSMGVWSDERGTNMLDTGAHFYDVYRCADGGYVSIGSIEPQFYALLLQQLELDPAALPRQNDRAAWVQLKQTVADRFATRTRAEWCAVMEGTDVCFAPVLSMEEAPSHPHNVARGTFVEVGGVVQPGPAPRFSRTPGAVARPAPHPGQHTDEVLASWGLAADRIAELRAAGAVS